MSDRRNANDIDQLKADANGMVDGNQLLDVIRKLSVDIHALKGHVTANTSFTKEILDNQQTARERADATDEKLDAMVSSSAEMIDLFQSGKKGVKFFQGTGRLLFKLAIWLTPLLTAWGAIVAIMHGQPPRGRE